MRIKTYLLTLTLLVSILFFALPRQAVFAAGGTISGYVRDENGNPLSGLRVLSNDGVTEVSTFTSSSGHYNLPNVPATSNHLRASDSSGARASSHYWGFQVANGISYTVNFALRPGKGQVCGYVTDQNKKGLAGVSINVYEKVPAGQQSAWEIATTQSSGDYCTQELLWGLPTGTYIVQASGATTISADFVNVTAGQKTSNINLSFMAGDGILSGRVTDSATGSGLGGAEIYADAGDFHVTVTTDSSGAYSLTNLPYRSYNVLVTKTGYAKAHRNVQVSSSTPVTNFNFQLTTQKGTISGKVTDGSGHAIQGVNIFADSDQGTGFGSIMTDSNGNYSIASVAPMLYYVHASKAGYANQVQMVTVVNGQTSANIDFHLGVAGGSISGWVKKNGQPAGYAKVYANSSAGAGQIFYGNTTADAGGYYAIPDLVPGQYDVHVSDVAGYANLVYFSIAVGSGNTTRDFNLTNGTSTISGRVTDTHGNPLAGVSVQPFNNANPGTWGNPFTDANGYYTVHNLLSGSYTVYANLAGFGSVTKEFISVASNSTATVNFILSQQGRALVSLPPTVTILTKPGRVVSFSPSIEVTQGGPASWTALSSVVWLHLGTAGTASQASGQTGTKLVLRFDPDRVSGLGTFSGTVDLTSPDADSGRITVKMVNVDKIYSTFMPFGSR